MEGLRAEIEAAYATAEKAVRGASDPFARGMAVKAISLLLELIQQCAGTQGGAEQQAQDGQHKQDQ